MNLNPDHQGTSGSSGFLAAPVSFPQSRTVGTFVGVFLNNDIVAPPPALKAQYETLLLRAIQEEDRIKRGRERTPEDILAEMREQLRLAGEDHQSHIAALRDQLRWLGEAGFASVECHWEYLDFAVFGGVKE
jgi:hypothetical protein